MNFRKEGFNMENSFKYFLFPDGSSTPSPYSTKNIIAALPENKKENHSKLFSGYVISHLDRKLELDNLVSKRMELKQDCELLEKEIRLKQQHLNQLQDEVATSQFNHQASSANKLAAGLAHEIRNPLTTIKGFIQLLRPELNSLGKTELADVALDEINRANDLISDFLAAFKQTSSKKAKLSLNKLAHLMHNLFASEALLKEVSLSVNLIEDGLFIYGDEKQLKQVIMNLLQNAFDAIADHAAEQGEIIIEVAKKEGHAVISIIDNGPGIEESIQAKLFTPFFTTKEKGTGIGLVICKQIIEEHGGFLSIVSSAGRTKFSIEIPIADH
jgi:signal transduction histidine kinase